MGTVCIQLVDDHEIVRAGFRHLLEKESDMKVVVESSTGKQAYLDFEKYEPDMLVMDISLPDISGLEVMRRILLGHPGARILVFSMHSGMVAERALQQGARGFVCKRSGARALISAIHQIMRGGCYLDGQAGAQALKKVIGLPKPISSLLSKRELEVCLLLTEGRSVAAIAEALHVSEKTIYTHRQHIMEKLDVTTTIELAQAATSMGIHSSS